MSAAAAHDLRVREATQAGADAVVALVRELGEGFGEPTEVDAAEAPVGLVAWSTRLDLYAAAPRGEIEGLVVSASARGAGVGALLVGEAVARLRASGCAEVAVITGFENRPARRLCEAAGLRDELLCLHAHFEASG